MTVTDLNKVSEVSTAEGAKARFKNGVYYVTSDDTTSDRFEISAKRELEREETPVGGPPQRHGTFTLKGLPVGAMVAISEDINIRYATKIDDGDEVPNNIRAEALIYIHDPAKEEDRAKNAVKFTNTRKITVRFRKTDSFGEALGGARFALYSDLECDEEHAVPLNFPEKPGYDTPDGLSLAATARDPDTGEELKMGDVQFKFLSGGLYYMKETNTLPGFNHNDYTYAVIVGRKGVTAAKAEGGPLNGTALEDEEILSDDEDNPILYAIYRLEDGKVDTALDVEQFGVMNTKTGSRRVSLRKTGEKTGDSITGLSGAHFRIFRIDLTEVTDGQPTGPDEKPVGYYVSGKSGVYFMGVLPFGIYYLVETAAPEGDYSGNAGKVFVLTVDKDGVTTAGNTVDNAHSVELTITGTEDAENKYVEAFREYIIGHDAPGGE